MSSLQKLSLTLQRSQSASSLLPLATPPRDNALHLWGQKDGIPPSEVTFSEQQPGLREGFVLLSKEEPKQQQSEPESLISVQPPQLVLESDTTAEHYNEQYDSRATSEEQTVYSDDSGEDSAPEEPLNNSVDEVSILKRLGLQREFYTEKEVETAFVHLSLAFKSDMFTLKQRLDVEERARDVAEENIQKELEGCRIILQKLKAACSDRQRQETLKQFEYNLQVLEASITQVTNSSEILGAVHQEARVSGGVQVMMEHVANLKSIHAKEHAELQEMKKIIQQNSRSRQFGDMRDDANFQTKHQMMRAMHQSTARRRVSIAVIPKQLVTFHIPDSKAADSEECRMDYSCTKITKHNVPLQNSRLRHPHEDSIGNYAQCLASNSNQPRPPSQRCEIKSEEISFHGSECKRNLKGKANWKSSRSGEAPISLSNTWKCICLRQNQEQKVGGILKKETLNRETETETESEDEDGYTSDTMSNASLMLEQQSPLSGLSCFLDSYQKILTSVVLTLIVAWLLQPKSFWFWP
ncbi:inositol 1,4,5-triphosphate receptor associated 1-like isoform X1 [Rhincodon typus]|uniref:inositol 1,4,5-triphosphate receptor associated 1-like isoform X1 n=1 Tax=Rhincodon typus TaxID=259920 RepID=UPI00202FF0CD|nr:inositol 1,4,5-triphosphate receptor associated 1-like isoform X1 [Rhincodon typus]